MEINKVYCMDCLEFLKQIDNKSIDLVVIDPPYNIGKDDWDKVELYEFWMKQVFKEIERVLKITGSFYIFHSEMEIVSDFMNFIRTETDFKFKQFIVWNKRFSESRMKGLLDGFIEIKNLQNYQQIAEYILFYTFQNKETNNLVFENIKEYLQIEENKCRNAKIDIDSIIPRTTNFYYFANGQSFGMPTKEKYLLLQEKTGFFKKSYDELTGMFEKARYTFNNLKTSHSVWNFDLVSNKENHITPKPIELIKNIILHSSNEGQMVLDCFMGTGTVALACKQLNRNFIGCDNDKSYVDEINNKLSQQQIQFVKVEGDKQ